LPNDSTIGFDSYRFKNLPPDWIASLTARGQSTVYTGQQLRKIGMPVGRHLCRAALPGRRRKAVALGYLHQRTGTSEAHYAHPPDPDYPV